MDAKTHWNSLYGNRSSDAVSWSEREPTLSLELPHAAGLTADSRVSTLGAGIPAFVDALVALGVRCVTVLDVSREALARASARIGEDAAVRWIEADVIGDWPPTTVDIWHDRGVFHFMTACRVR